MSEVIYARPTTRVAAVAAPGVTLIATVLNSSATLPPDLAHGSPVTLAWPDTAVHDLSD